MSEHREGTFVFMILKQGGMIYVLIWNLFMEGYIVGNVLM